MNLVTFDFTDQQACLDHARRKIMQQYPSAVDVYFRLVDFNEMGRRGPPSGIRIQVMAYPVQKLTPKGGWFVDLGDRSHKLKLAVFGPGRCQRVFKQHQQRDLVQDFEMRKKTQLDISQRTARNAARCIELLKLKGRRPKGMAFDHYDFNGKFDDLN